MPIDELVFVQGPVMTEAHVHAMERVDALWLFPDEFERTLIGEVVRHLKALNGSAVPVALEGRPLTTDHRRPMPGFLDDWRVEYRAPTVEECYDCDQ